MILGATSYWEVITYCLKCTDSQKESDIISQEIILSVCTDRSMLR